MEKQNIKESLAHHKATLIASCVIMEVCLSVMLFYFFLREKPLYCWFILGLMLANLAATISFSVLFSDDSYDAQAPSHFNYFRELFLLLFRFFSGIVVILNILVLSSLFISVLKANSIIEIGWFIALVLVFGLPTGRYIKAIRFLPEIDLKREEPPSEAKEEKKKDSLTEEQAFSIITQAVYDKDIVGVAEFIAAHKDHINVVHPQTGTNALWVAAACGAQDIVKLLLQHGADVNNTNQEGKSVVDIAAERGYGDIVRMLK